MWEPGHAIWRTASAAPIVKALILLQLADRLRGADYGGEPRLRADRMRTQQRKG